MLTLTKKDLVALGYGASFSADIIRQAKHLMASKGYTFYVSRKLGRVPVEAVEEILGVKFNAKDLEKLNKTSGTSASKEV
ncbi:MAG: DUF3173 domain-containing protein [Brevinema sp.]